MERRFGYDFSRVRIHSDAAAAWRARELGALAFTEGDDISFAAGHYSPESGAGCRLLAHELAHVVQQRTLGRRTQKKDGPAVPVPAAANEVLPYPVGARVLVTSLILPRILDAVATLASAAAEEYKALIEALRDEDVAKSVIATVTISTPDLVEATIPIPAIPAKGSRPAIPALRVEISLERQSDGTFEGQIRWSGARTGREIFSGFSAVKQADGTIILSKTKETPRVTITPPGAKGERVVQVTDLPLLAKAIVGDPVKVVALTELQAPAKSASETQEIKEKTTAVREQVAEKRRQLVAGVGLQHGQQLDPMFFAGWRYTLTPLGNLAQVPVQVQLDYTPTDSIRAGVSAGLQTVLPTRVPIDLRIIQVGIKGGTLRGATPQGGGDRPLVPVLGPTVGAGAGVELGKVRVSIDVEHLQNLFKNGPNVQSVSLGAGIAF
jgi:hypothetical protein